MDLSSLRRKQSTVTYSKRNRQSNSAQSSPAAARTTTAAAPTSSSGSSDDEAGPSRPDRSPGSQNGRATGSSPKSTISKPVRTEDAASLTSKATPRLGNGSATKSAHTTPSGTRLGAASTSRAVLTSTSLSTPGIFSKSASSSSGLNSTKSLPQRPARAASPSARKSGQTPGSTLPAKRSASTSPRKGSASVSPSKRQARSRTPSRPAQDLSSLFDAIEPTLPRSQTPFARSKSQPTARLHQDSSDDSLGETARFETSPPQTPTIPSNSLEDTQPPPADSMTSPSKRPSMADRMAPRAVRPARSKVDEIAEALNNSRRGSLRRSETAPSVVLESSSGRPAVDGEKAASLRTLDDGAKSPHMSDAGSTRFETASQADSQSQEGATALGARRLAGIKQNSASNAKRTYGLQRSFLADQAEEDLLAEQSSAPQLASQSTSQTHIEDEIEAQIRGHGTAPNTSSRVCVPWTSRKVDAGPAPRESYAELLKKWGEGADNIEWDESQDPTLNLKSITSLRSTGELRRFNDDLEYLFSGLEASQALSIRKSSAVELVRLVCGKPDTGSLDDDDDAEDDQEAEDPLAPAQSAEFLRKLKASDLISRLFDLLRDAKAGEGVDVVLDAAVSVYIAKLLRSASSTEPLVRERSSELCGSLRDLLARSDRPQGQDRKDGFALLRVSELKKHNIASRSDRKTLDELRSIARISKLFVAGAKSWTLRNLVLGACCSLIALPRRLLADGATDDLLVSHGESPSLFAVVLNVMVLEGVKARQRLNDFAKGLELMPASAVEAVPDLETIDLCIRFLDKGMDILYLELDQAVPASSETLDALQHLISFAIQAAPFGQNSWDAARDAVAAVAKGSWPRALQVLHGLLKTLLDLSQVDPNWSESLASSPQLQASIMRALLLSHQSALRLSKTAGKLDAALFDDVVHLALAVLTNLLIKQLDKARDALESVGLEGSCWGRRACCIDCTCEDKVPALRLLSRVFFETRIAAASQDDSNAAYLSNSIATALAQFAVGGPKRLDACRDALDAELPKTKVEVIRRDGLQTLLEAVEEFAVVHEAALNADRMRSAQAEAGQLNEDGEEKQGEEAAVEEASNPVALEAGQLIKDLAITLRQMA